MTVHMSATTKVDFTGLAEFARKLREATKLGIERASRVFSKAYQNKIKSGGHISKTPMMRVKDTKTWTARPHLADVIGNKVWVFRDGTGFAGFSGAYSRYARHAHLIEKGTTNRVRRRIGGKYSGIESAAWFKVLSEQRKNWYRRTGRGPSLFLLKKAFEEAKTQAASEFTSAVKGHL